MDLIEMNLQKQIDKVKQEIKSCYIEEFDSLIYKYNIFNEIKNTFSENMVKKEEFKKILENDLRVLEKIYHKFLDVNINFSPRTFDNVMLEEFLKEMSVDYPKFGSDVYRGIYYSVIDDCCENEGGYYIEFYKYLDNGCDEVDWDDRLDYMVIHADYDDEMRNPQKYVEKYIDDLINELEKDISEEL